MRIYVSGPVTGHEDTAKRRFDQSPLEAWKVGDKLHKTLHEVEFINPYEVNQMMTYGLNKEEVTHEDYMTVSMAMLSICDSILLLDDWEDSKGCMQEYEYAKEHGYQIFYQSEPKQK